MLKKRIITAVVLLAVLLWVLFALDDVGFAAFVAVVSGIGAYEWAALGGIKARQQRAGYALLVAIGGFSLYRQADLAHVLPIISGAALACWFILTSWLVWLQLKGLPTGYQRWSLLLAPAVLIGVQLSLIALRQQSGVWMLLYVLAIAWAADIGAYFAGRAFGKHKLADRISPGKTWEGVAGGLVAVLLLSWIASLWLAPLAEHLPLVFVAAVVAAVFSVAGDLFESTLKRCAGAKDSGWILPGHGGVLDRIDSVLASVPVFVALTVGSGLLAVS